MPNSIPYEYSLSDNAFMAISACDDDNTRRIILALESLARDPSRRGIYVGADYKGRIIPWLEVGEFLVGYLVDHRGKHIHIGEVRRIEN